MASSKDKEPTLSEKIDAFEQTISVYQERSSASGNIPAMEYGQGAEAGKATSTGSSQTIQPSNSDLICDIELAAKRCLKPGDYAYWLVYYKSLEIVVAPKDTDIFNAFISRAPEHQREAIASIDFRMRHTLGAELLRTGIAPLSVYLAPVDVRCPRKAKSRLSHLDGTH